MKRILFLIALSYFATPFLSFSQSTEDFSDETISGVTITTNTGLTISSSNLDWSTYTNQLDYNNVSLSPPIPYITPSSNNDFFQITLSDQSKVFSSIEFDLWLNYGDMFGTGDMGCDCKSYTSENQLIETISKGSNEVAKNFIFNSGSIKKIICNPTNVEGGNSLLVDDIVFTIAQLENNNDILLNGTTSAENNQIKNIADPTDAQDAATKSYVDGNVNSFSGSYNDLINQPSLRDLTGDNPVIFGSLSAFGGTYNNGAILDLVANNEGDLITGYKNGSSEDRFNVKLDNTNENAVVSSGGGYNLKLYSEGGTMEFEGDNMMSTPSFIFNGAVTATSFAGDGSQLTNLPTSDVSYNDLTDKPTTYTQAQVDALIQNLQTQIDAITPTIPSGGSENQFLAIKNGVPAWVYKIEWPASGSVLDSEGNSYDYLTYGDQAWTVINAEMETYRDGTMIPKVIDNSEWSNLSKGAWCYYNNDPTKGKIYNWFALMGIHDDDPNTPNKEFAPENWHVPTKSEFAILTQYLISNGYNYDNTTIENKIGKSVASNTGWDSSTNTGAIGNDQESNNDSGFNAFPVGLRNGSNGQFNSEGMRSIFWTISEEQDLTRASNNGLVYFGSMFDSNSNSKNAGYLVRFVRD